MSKVGEALFHAVDEYLHASFLKGYPEGHCNPERLAALRTTFLTMCAIPLDTVGQPEQGDHPKGGKMYRGYNTSETLQKLRDEIESLRGALQAALLSLEKVEEALAHPAQSRRRVSALLDDALVVIREELDE